MDIQDPKDIAPHLTKEGEVEKRPDGTWRISFRLGPLSWCERVTQDIYGGKGWLVGPGLFELDLLNKGNRLTRITEGRFVLDTGERGAGDRLILMEGDQWMAILVDVPFREGGDELRRLASFFSQVTGWPVDRPEVAPPPPGERDAVKKATTVPRDRLSDREHAAPLPLDAPVAHVFVRFERDHPFTSVRIERTATVCTVAMMEPRGSVILGVIAGTVAALFIIAGIVAMAEAYGLLPGPFASPAIAIPVACLLFIAYCAVLWRTQFRKLDRRLVLDKGDDSIRMDNRHLAKASAARAVHLVLVQPGGDSDPYYVVRIRSSPRDVDVPLLSKAPAPLYDLAERLAHFLGVPVQRQ